MKEPAPLDLRHEPIFAQLKAAGWGERGELAIECPVAAGTGSVHVRVRKRGNRFDVDDSGAAVAGAGKPDGWLEAGPGAADRRCLARRVRRAGRAS